MNVASTTSLRSLVSIIHISRTRAISHLHPNKRSQIFKLNISKQNRSAFYKARLSNALFNDTNDDIVSSTQRSSPPLEIKSLPWKTAALGLSSLWTLLNPMIAIAAAENGVAYNPEGGSETFKTIAGVAYIVLVIIYFVRLFKKRADRATSVKIASSSEEEEEEEEEEQEEEEVQDVSPVQCLIGVAQASVICYLLFLLSTSIDAFFDKQTLPSQYTARNIAVLVQTVARGLVYLATFIFGANAVGLAALGTALVVAPEWVANTGPGSKNQKERLPNVKVTDDIVAIRRAFKEAENMGKKAAEKDTR